MSIFNFFKKTETFSNVEIEREYQKAIGVVRSVDEGRCASLVRDMKEYAKKFCSPKEGEDLLAQKAEFMRVYAFRAYQWRCYHTLNYKRRKFNTVPLWTQKWHDYEQNSRLKAQKRWRELTARAR